MELAEQKNADLVLANDPDADRLALCTQNPLTKKWEPLSGNHIGALLGHALLEATCHVPNRLVVTTLVSSRLLKAMAGHYHVHYGEALTGFRYIAALAREHAQKHKTHCVFAYEEALGYFVGAKQPLEKDGISAALLLTQLAQVLHHQGKTLYHRLDEIALQYGLYETGQCSVQFDGMQAQTAMAQLMKKLREDPQSLISYMDCNLFNCQDLLEGSPDFPPANVLVYELALRGNKFRGDASQGSKFSGDESRRDPLRARLVIRPSGTEPKVKFYVECMQKHCTPKNLPALRQNLKHRVQTSVR